MVVNFYKILRRMVEGKAHICLPLAYRKAFYCVNYFVGNPEGKLWSSGSGNILLFLGGCSWHRETLKGKNKWSACVFLLSSYVNWVSDVSSLYSTYLPAVKRSLRLNQK